MGNRSTSRRAALDFLQRVANTGIRSDRDLTSYVVRVTAICVVIAVCLDVVNQMIFFVNWVTAFRSWAISAVIVLVIAVPISRAIGKAHLNLYRAKQVVDELSRTDPLTGLPNRRALIEAAEAAPAAALVLVIFDIDRFKRVNDTYGHAAGDRVIQVLAETMMADLGAFGSLCRLGGEEFALLTPNNRIEDMLDGIWRFRDHMASTPVMIGEVAITVTISAGVAVRSPGGSFGQLYTDADRALYMAKAAGRNRINYAESLEALRAPQPEGERRQWRGSEPDRAAAEETEKPGVRSVA